METHLRTDLVFTALEMAIGQRKPHKVIHYSDRGSQLRLWPLAAVVARPA